MRSWRGWNVRFTDGICERCLGRFRAEYREYLERVPPTKAVPTLPAARPVGAIRVPVSDPVRAA